MVSIPDVDGLGGWDREAGGAFNCDDHRIYKNPQERAAMMPAPVIGFFLESAWRKPNVAEFERAAR